MGKLPKIRLLGKTKSGAVYIGLTDPQRSSLANEKIGRIHIRDFVCLQLSRLTRFTLLGMGQMAKAIQTANNHLASVSVWLRPRLSVCSLGFTFDTLRPSP
jgi:hypothetical protein